MNISFSSFFFLVDSSIFVDIRNINEIQGKIFFKVVFQPDFECMKEIFERVVENRPLPAEIDIHIERRRERICRCRVINQIKI